MIERIKLMIKQKPILLYQARKIKQILLYLRRPISGKNNQILKYGGLKKVVFDIIGNNNVIEINKGAVLKNTTIFIRGNNHHFSLGEGAQYKGGSISFEEHDCEIIIGAKTTIESAHLAATEPFTKIEIGEDCMFSRNIEMSTSDAHSILDKTTGKRINPAQNIVIGNHVWLGANAIILKGANIGDHSIIGTHAIATKDIPANSIAAGIPAKIIKSNIDWSRERI
jgi:acetyltransferase-like isoleucine patch superfamily enzyme